MSKIEEALRRAQNTRSSDTEGAVKPTGLVGRATSPATSRQLVGLSSAEEIAHMREQERRDTADLARRKIISGDLQDRQLTDAFRQIRTSLLQKTADKNFVLLVTSVAPDGGASFVSSNLAASFAFDASKTGMIIDCNLREPAFDDLLLDREDLPGLTDYLAGAEEQVENIIHPVGIPRLRLIPVGNQRTQAGEFFTAPKLGQLLQELRQRYRERYIIIDAPPICDAADARILTELCDYTLLVVPYGKVTSAQVEAAAEAVGSDKLVGCVMNNETRLPPLAPGSGARA